MEEEESAESPSRTSVNEDRPPRLGGIDIRRSLFTHFGNRPTVAGTASIEGKLDELRHKTRRGFGRMSKEVGEGSERIFVLEDTIIDLQARVKSLEEMVTSFAATRPGSRSLDPSHGESAPVILTSSLWN